MPRRLAVGSHERSATTFQGAMIAVYASVATVTSASAMSAAFGGLGVRGKMIVVGAPGDPLVLMPGMLIGGNRSIHGHASGTSMDSQDTLAFSALTTVRPMIETLPLEQAAEAYERMMSGDARFRMVLTTGA